MVKTFKHRTTGELATYKDGLLKSGRCVVDIGKEPDNKFWEEVENESDIWT